MNHTDHIADANEEAWTTATSLPAAVIYSQAIVTKNRVHLLGGYADGGPSSTALTAPINPDGTLGAWTTGASLPATVYVSQAIVTKNRVHLLGGYVVGASSSTVYTAPVNPDGTLGTWTTVLAQTKPEELPMPTLNLESPADLSDIDPAPCKTPVVLEAKFELTCVQSIDEAIGYLKAMRTIKLQEDKDRL